MKALLNTGILSETVETRPRAACGLKNQRYPKRPGVVFTRYDACKLQPITQTLGSAKSMAGAEAWDEASVIGEASA